MAVKSLPKNTPVNAKLLFGTISREACTNFLSQVCSIMVDTISLNTGKRAADNKRLVDHFNAAIGRGIHS